LHNLLFLNADFSNRLELESLSKNFCHVLWETGLPLPDEISGKSPLIGIHNGIAVYLLYNGVLDDKTAHGGNALTRAVLDILPLHSGPKIIYGTSCRVGESRLMQEQITFRQIPYALKVD
jgi:adenine-specific DNA-methyltransferase